MPSIGGSACGCCGIFFEKQYTFYIFAQYSTLLAHYHGNLLFVGINYDSDKEHECVIERFVKE
ncbi:MAG: hypothetical protein MJZ66_11000 [Bacteroidales bacterium]|nr:hypothetical protein [Bacteroidales bacterium]